MINKVHPLTVYLPDQRGVELSRFGAGNVKLGFGVFTYSRLAGAPMPFAQRVMMSDGGIVPPNHTCPGATTECEAICYAKRIAGGARTIHEINSARADVPPIPEGCRVIRIHVSGDFDSLEYIHNWIVRLQERPDVTCWAYTRSWRVKELLPALEELRALPNMQLFASMDPSTEELPPFGWRRAWIWRDAPNGPWPMESRLLTTSDSRRKASFVKPLDVTEMLDPSRQYIGVPHNMTASVRHGDGLNHFTPAYVCPEETGRKSNCLECGYCFEGQQHDVVFLEHGGPK